MGYDVLEVCRHVINYSNEKDYGISNLKLQKVLYFIQAYFLMSKEDHSPCFDDRIEAWDFGPVVPKAYHEYKRFGSGDIPTIESYLCIDNENIWNIERIEFNDSILEDNDKKLIDDIVDKFSNYTATDLVSITHHQSPWIDAYVPYMNNEITIDSIKRYFNA